MNLKIQALLFVAAFTVYGNADNRAVFEAPGEFYLTDDTGNLNGDASRSYLDIQSVKLSIGESFSIVQIKVLGKFPNPEVMLGTGFQFYIDFFEQPPGEPSQSESIGQLRITYGSRDWDYAYYANSKSDEAIELELMMETSAKTITITFPTKILSHSNAVTVGANTENFPKWKPITTQPSILIPPLEQAKLELR